jgi:outer membrane protein assembly factor BamB
MTILMPLRFPGSSTEETTGGRHARAANRKAASCRTARGIVLAAALLLSLAHALEAAHAADWPQWGGRNERNFVSEEKDLPATFGPEATKTEDGQTTTTPSRNLKWSVALGSQVYPSPAIAGGRIFTGANGARANGEDGRFDQVIIGGVLFCLDEASGKRLWQLDIPRFRTKNPKYNADKLNLGLCSSPTVDGDRVYVMTSRGEVLCLDVAGLANGNDGPYTDEGLYLADGREYPDKPGRFDPKDLSPAPAALNLRPTDGDIVWRYDFVKELDVWPHDAVDCSVLASGDYLYICTCNGRESSHKSVPSPNAPDMIVLDKKTGALLAVMENPLGNAIFHGDWSSPTLAHAGGKNLVVWGGGDGVCYAFDAAFTPGEDGKPGKLRQVWSFDCNPAQHKTKDGKPIPYGVDNGPSEIIATPVCWNERVYVAVGQDSHHGMGAGCFSCIDATKEGDITESGRVWQNLDVQRSFSSAAVTTDGLVFIADYTGILRCLDAATGETYWRHDLKGRVFGSPLIAGGKVYIGTEAGRLTVASAAKEKKVLWETKFASGLYASPVAANGVLYITTQKRLYAFQVPKDILDAGEEITEQKREGSK